MPWSVRVTLRPRWKRGTPSSSSSARMRMETVACVTLRRAAALVKLRSWAILSKVLIWSRSIGAPTRLLHRRRRARRFRRCMRRLPDACQSLGGGGIGRLDGGQLMRQTADAHDRVLQSRKLGEPAMTYRAGDTRYDTMEYRRTGQWGLKLPAISLGLWQNFGGTRDYPSAFEILGYAFDQGVTHFDLAN